VRETYTPEFLAELCRRTSLAELVRRWGVVLRQDGRELVGLCPVHPERTPSFRVAEGKGFVHCFGCGFHADAISLYRRMTGAGFVDAVQALAAEAGMSSSSPRHTTSAPAPIAPVVSAEPLPPRALRGSPLLDSIWEAAQPFLGSPAEAYIIHRCGRAPRWPDLRYLPATEKHPHPAMVALITDFATGERVSLHFTLLRPGGLGKADIERAKRTLKGHSGFGVIRLIPDADVTLALGLAEGIETAVSVMTSGWRPVWATVNAGNMAKLPVLDGIEALAIFADHDPAGLAGASTLAARWRASGRTAEVIAPRGHKADWNDIATKEAA